MFKQLIVIFSISEGKLQISIHFILLFLQSISKVFAINTVMLDVHMCRQFDRLSVNADRVDATSEKCSNAHTDTHPYTFHIHAWTSFTGCVSKSVYAPPLCFSVFSLNVTSHCFKRATIAIFVSSGVDGFLSRFEEAWWNTNFLSSLCCIYIFTFRNNISRKTTKLKKKTVTEKRFV